MQGLSQSAPLQARRRAPARSHRSDEPSWAFVTLAADGTVPTSRPSFALIAATGPGALSHAGQMVPLEAGDFALVDLALPICLEPASANAGARLLDFGDRSLDRQLGGVRPLLGQRLRGDDPVGTAVGTLLDQLAALRAIGYADLGDGVLATIISLLAVLTARARSPGRTRHAAAMLQRAQGIIAVKLDDPRLRVARVAELLGISPRHLSALFAPLGQSPTEYIASLRMKRAQALLADPSQAQRQIIDIAMACGFDDQSHFARCFKAHVGTTPRCFRDANGRRQDEIVV